MVVHKLLLTDNSAVMPCGAPPPPPLLSLSPTRFASVALISRNFAVAATVVPSNTVKIYAEPTTDRLRSTLPSGKEKVIQTQPT